MIFLLYYLWNLINFFLYLNLNFINVTYLKFNKFNIVFKKSIEKLTFLEKFFLIFFNKKNWFYTSFYNFVGFDKKIDILKKKFYPLINFFNILNVSNINNNKHINYCNNLNLNYKFSNYLDFLVFKKLIFTKYYNILNLNFFNNYDNFFNLIKINFLFWFLKSKQKNNNLNKQFNLNYYNDWVNFTFNNYNYKFNLIIVNKIFLKKFKEKKFLNLKKTINFFNTTYFFKNNNLSLNDFSKNINLFSIKFNYYKSFFFKKINFNNSFFKNLKYSFPIRFSESSLNKYINFYNLTDYKFYFLRKNRIFNKSRYSRNRQLYRTGVYWCLWLNIIIVYGLYFFFYRFTFNFGYFWLGLFLLMYSFIFSRICKYKFYNIFELYKEFYNLFNWFGFVFYNIFFYISFLGNYFFKKYSLLNLILNKTNYILYNLIYLLKKLYLKIKKKKDYGFVFIWENYRFVDNSFLKYKTIINWFVQFYKVLIY